MMMMMMMCPCICVMCWQLAAIKSVQIHCAMQGIRTCLMDRTRPAAPHTPALFTAAAAEQLEAAPAIVHFRGSPSITPSQLLSPYVQPPSKPWAFACLNPYKREWFRVLDETLWAGWRPQQAAFERAAAEWLAELCRLLQGARTHKQQQQQQQTGATGGIGRAACDFPGSNSNVASSGSSGGGDDGDVKPAGRESLVAAISADAGFDAAAFLGNVAALCVELAEDCGVSCA
jgi:hypothetical protein